MHSPSEGDSGSASGSEASDEDCNSSADGGDQRVQSVDGRGHVDNSGCDRVSTPSCSAEAGGASSSQGAEQASDEAKAAEAPVTKPMLAGRSSMMFVVGSAGPQEVRKPLLARSVTKGLVKLAIEVANALCDSDGKALSESFGNFDRRVAIGWLLADATGRPLLSRAQAHAVGIKAQREGGYIAASIKTARKQAGATARAASTDASAAQDAAERAVLSAAAGDIALPQLPAAAAPSAAPSGSRKRAREQEPSALEQLETRHRQQEAEAAILRADRDVKRAEAAEASAEAVEQTTMALFERSMEVARRFLGEKRRVRQLASEAMDRAQKRYHEAQWATKNAEMATLKAQLVARDAMIDSLLLGLQWNVVSYEESTGETL